MLASIHNQQPINNNLQITFQVRNAQTKLLSTRPSSTFLAINDPLNFGNFNRSDFNPRINVSLGFIPNQLT